jgi:UDP-glucose:glycoprotein glucosyltransferase
VVLVPRVIVTEFPLQSFYRFVSSPRLQSSSISSVGSSDPNNNNSSTSSESGWVGASFTRLPRHLTLTTRVDVPEPWNVQTSRAEQDIDNLRCSSSSSSSSCGDNNNNNNSNNKKKKDLTSIGYYIKSLLVAGQCFQTERGEEEGNGGGGGGGSYGAPPNGLQLTLSPLEYRDSDQGSDNNNNNNNNRIISDTLVMQNLGYYQLQVPLPGLFLLDLAEAGRGRELFSINSVNEQIVAVKSFGDVVRRLLVSKRPGKEHLSLLGGGGEEGEEEKEAGNAKQKKSNSDSADSSSSSFWQNLKSSFFGGSDGEGTEKKKKNSLQRQLGQSQEEGEEDDNRIHVFSLATGHLYERFLRIMMLSATKQTSRPIKFWLFENYLSPRFKEIAAMMSEKYGFQIGYVTYKWPQW